MDTPSVLSLDEGDVGLSRLARTCGIAQWNGPKLGRSESEPDILLHEHREGLQTGDDMLRENCIISMRKVTDVIGSAPDPSAVECAFDSGR
jgi:hypothetical protein